ncbi:MULTISPECIES: hypothetical protein [Microbispora]|uniref:Uncharacterized protein n=2 Tax=Microbispora TaxID=2005 RepID=A0A5J5JTV0_9ACTN|nr:MULTISPECIES: hypothetical protein [Microbispora]KAA9373370.1 hypothetical protein F5972_35460 [Microbispora cellulosiformans]GIH36928.1 hypothetical protein Mam01_70920 [Microbispora amethystogenes]
MTLTAVILLGAFHGINPAMGWLFAVARGLQERSRDLLLQSLPVIALGHLASVALVVAVVSATGSLVTGTALAIGAGVLLVGFGLWHLLARRHFRWVGMRLSLPQLAAWSFLMSSVHGAGLMLLPVLTRMPASHHGHALSGGLLVAGVHTLAMFLTATVVAVVVYEFLGVAVLRRAWFNLDRMWAFALVGAGVLTLVAAV